MELITISQVAKEFGVSTRMLRYYEEIGLIKSSRMADYAYRMYDEEATHRLQQILILRKLRIPLKEIAIVLENKEAGKIIDVFAEQLQQIQDEITALSTMRAILERFVQVLQMEINVDYHLTLLTDAQLLSAINALSLTKIQFKEERSMKDLEQASQSLRTVGDVRIIYLPPLTVASSHVITDGPELKAAEGLNNFIQATGLYTIKPDARVFGFNHPNPTEQNPIYGYEFWVTIPDDLDVPSPLEKKRYPGGMYAVHTMDFPNFQEWDVLLNWVNGSELYEANMSGDPSVMNGLMEEHIGYLYHQVNEKGGWDGYAHKQLDLYLPIKPAETK